MIDFLGSSDGIRLIPGLLVSGIIFNYIIFKCQHTFNLEMHVWKVDSFIFRTKTEIDASQIKRIRNKLLLGYYEKKIKVDLDIPTEN